MSQAIVVGGGTNGLAAAIALARAGREVLVLEASGRLGGIAASEEFHPGFRSAGVLDFGVVGPVAAALGVPARPDDPVGWFESGPSRVAGPERDRLAQWIEPVRPFVSALFEGAPPRIDPDAPLLPLARTAFALRRLGRDRMLDLLRIGALSAEDWLSEWFTDPRQRGLLAAEGLVGAWVGPRQPTTAALVLRRMCLGSGIATGGEAVGVLEAAARAAGVKVRTESPVRRIVVEGGRVRGVELDGAARIDAAVVVACCHPRLALIDLLDPADLPGAWRRPVLGIRSRGQIAHLLLALSSDPESPGTRGWIDPDPGRTERRLDAMKYREQPALDAGFGPLEVVFLHRLDPASAPPDCGVASVRWHAAPRGPWSADYRERVADAIVAGLEPFLPGLGACVIARSLRAPHDLAARYHNPGGHVFHGEHAIDQLLFSRPALGIAQYRTPISGLWLGSAGCHPGGGVIGSPGWLAGRAAAEDA